MSDDGPGHIVPVPPLERTRIADGATVGIGSLPHRDPAAAAAFAIGEFDIATVPSLPVRSAAEGLLARAVAGLAGVTVDPAGELVVDPAAVDPQAPIDVDLAGEAFVGHRGFLDLAGRVRLDGSPVSWQHVGPITLGSALCRAGCDAPTAFTLAIRAVRAGLATQSAAIATVLPESPQLVLLDEPGLDVLMAPDFPIPPDEAVDLMSSAMAALAPGATAGLHCCATADLATMLASGPAVLSIPADDRVVAYAGSVAQFIGDGGVIAWGVVPTEGPIGAGAERHWRTLSDLWCALVRQGCDPVTLREQSLISPACGLGMHTVSVARRIARQTRDVAQRVKDQAGATRFALGA